MPPNLKSLSGKEVVTALGRFGFGVLSQRGSHIKVSGSKRDCLKGLRLAIQIPDQVLYQPHTGFFFHLSPAKMTFHGNSGCLELQLA